MFLSKIHFLKFAWRAGPRGSRRTSCVASPGLLFCFGFTKWKECRIWCFFTRPRDSFVCACGQPPLRRTHSRMQGQGRLGSQRHSGSSRLSKPSTCDATWHRCSGSTQQSQWERRANWVVRLPARTSPCTPTGAAPRQVLCKTSTSASDAFISPTEVASFLQVGSVMVCSSKHARALFQSRLLIKGLGTECHSGAGRQGSATFAAEYRRHRFCTDTQQVSGEHGTACKASTCLPALLRKTCNIAPLQAATCQDQGGRGTCNTAGAKHQ